MVEVIKQGYKQTEIGVIPDDWELKELGELNTKKFPTLNPQMYKDEFFEYYSIPDYQENKKPSFVLGRIIQSSKIILRDNAILFGRLNPRVEKVWLVKSLSNNRKIGSGEWITILPDNTNYISKYIYYLVWSKYVMPVAKENVEGSTPSRQRVISSFFYKIQVPIPISPKEQSAIASVLSDTDELIEQLDILIVKKKNIKQRAMQELLTSKRRLPGFKGKWEVKKLPEVCWFQEGPGVRNYQFTQSGVKLLNGTNISNGKLILENTERYISEKEAYGVYKHFLADKGDILIASSGITIDKFHEKVAICKSENLPLCMNTSTIRFKITSNFLDRDFLFHFLKSDSFKGQICKQITGSAQLNFGPAHLKKTDIKLPLSIEEQSAITQVISDMDTELEELEQKSDKYLKLKTGMMQQLLTGRIRLKC